MATTKYSKSRMKPVHIVKESSGDRDLHFAYTVPDKNYSHIANYTTYWWYKVASGQWHHGPTDVNDDPHGLTLWGMSYYTAPDSAVVVRASVQAISTNDSSGKPYFEEPPSEFLYYYFDSNKPGIPSYTVPNITIGLQTGSTNTIYATWSWDHTAQTDHFNVEWKYDTGDGVWFDGSSGTVNPDVRQATYNAPSGFESDSEYSRFQRRLSNRIHKLADPVNTILCIGTGFGQVRYILHRKRTKPLLPRIK